MTMFLLRDDDPNATTDPARLARAYAPLLDAGFPINFAVIPSVALDTRAPDGARERFLDERSPDCADERPLTRDTPLVQWLRANEGCTDVFVHGLSHRRIAGGTELGALSRRDAGERLDRAIAIFEDVLERRPQGFVAPWDALSRGAVEATCARFPLVSTSFLDRARLPVAAWPAHVMERLSRREALRYGDAWILRHRGGKLSGETAPADVPHVLAELSHKAEIAVVMLHHWMFWEKDEPHPVVRALARSLRGARVVTVREAARHLHVSKGARTLSAAINA
jgi:predicted deacetylase